MSHHTVDLPEVERDERRDKPQTSNWMNKFKKQDSEGEAKRKQEKEIRNKVIEEEADEEEFKKLPAVRLWMAFIWIGCTAVFIWYLTKIVNQYQSAVANPASTVGYANDTILQLPSVTICNWNQDPNFDGSCTFCQLTLVSCQNLSVVNSSSEEAVCNDIWKPIQYNTTQGEFYCYEFNNDPNNVVLSSSTGYGGSLATVWQIQLPPASDPPTNRAALQVTFEVQGKTDNNSIWNEISFAPTGYDTFFGIMLVTTVHNEIPDDDPGHQFNTYQKIGSQVQLLYDQNSTTSFVGISFAFQTLSVEMITYDISYTLENFFGDFAGMIGTLLGLDTIKVAISIPTMYFAWRLRTLSPLEDVFNG